MANTDCISFTPGILIWKVKCEVTAHKVRFRPLNVSLTAAEPIPQGHSTPLGTNLHEDL